MRTITTASTAAARGREHEQHGGQRHGHAWREQHAHTAAEHGQYGGEHYADQHGGPPGLQAL